MEVTEVFEQARNWTSSSRILPSMGAGLVRLAMPESTGGDGVLEVRAQDMPRAVREANDVAERALVRDVIGTFCARTPSDSRKVVWASDGLVVWTGLEISVVSPDAETCKFVLQKTPITGDPVPRIIEQIRETTKLSRKSIGELVGVSRQSVNNWERRQAIASDNRRRLLAVLDIFDRARKRYPTKAQLTDWLHTPCTEDGKTPADLIVAGDYDRARYYAVASPTPGVRPLPDWAARPVPGKFAGSVRIRRQASPAESSPKNTQGGGQE